VDNDYPPKFGRLVELLRALNPAVTAGIIERHAHAIQFHLLVLVAGDRGYEIGGDDEEGFFAQPQTTARGHAREMRDLRGKARKAILGKLSMEGWVRVWAALPERTKRRLFRPRLLETKAGRTIDRNAFVGFSAPKFAMLAPKPGLVLPAIEGELQRLKMTPDALRQHRRKDEKEQNAINAIRNAYRELTGHPIRTGRSAGRLHVLGRQIDVLFGAKLFAAVRDTRRLRQ
jgi:hypothetical protein